jgi:diamine N-acetyltransferase
LDATEKTNGVSLRTLQYKDAQLMLEWLNDKDCTQFLQLSRFSFSMDKVNEFIRDASRGGNNRHYAIVSPDDEYLGTVSLKEINHVDKNAEYAISLRKKAMGRGIAKRATQEILSIAFMELNLNKVYLNVLSENKRAISLYSKIGFIREGVFVNHILLNGEFKNLEWHRLLKSEWLLLTEGVRG